MEAINITVNLQGSITQSWEELSASIKKQMASRGYRASNELRNAALDVLKGQRSGRRYRVPGTKQFYTASAPGEPPAVRTGTFRLGWKPQSYVENGGNTVISRIRNETTTENGEYKLAELLEEGTVNMAPRPHHEKIQEKALPKIVKIYSEPYAGG